MLDAEIGVSNSVIGNTISHYKVLRLLGRGGMGEVYEAVDETLSRHVAIKVLLPQYAAEADVVARFFNEARSVNLIGHPGLVQVFEFGKMPDGGAFMVMEYIAGVTLRDRLKESGLLPEIEALQIALQLSSALAAAHAKDIVHRDLKPGNVMLVPDPVLPTGQRVKLLDFGIAKLGTQSAASEQPRTRTGLAIGTPTYMSPEQCRGDVAIDDITLGAAGSYRYDSQQNLGNMRLSQYNANNGYVGNTFLWTIPDPPFITPIKLSLGDPKRDRCGIATRNSGSAHWANDRRDHCCAPGIRHSSCGRDTLPRLRAYWTAAEEVDLEAINERLWAWVDANGGPQPSRDKAMILVRMLICLAAVPNRELEEVGYFEDLLTLYGLPRLRPGRAAEAATAQPAGHDVIAGAARQQGDARRLQQRGREPGNLGGRRAGLNQRRETHRSQCRCPVRSVSRRLEVGVGGGSGCFRAPLRRGCRAGCPLRRRPGGLPQLHPSVPGSDPGGTRDRLPDQRHRRGRGDRLCPRPPP